MSFGAGVGNSNLGGSSVVTRILDGVGGGSGVVLARAGPGLNMRCSRLHEGRTPIAVTSAAVRMGLIGIEHPGALRRRSSSDLNDAFRRQHLIQGQTRESAGAAP